MNRPSLYILDGHKPVPCPDPLLWGKWFETADRVVAQDTVLGVLISTVFLGLDHNFSNDGAPILFETMCFTEIEDVFQQQLRYTTWEEAEAGHRAIVELVRVSLPIAQ